MAAPPIAATPAEPPKAEESEESSDEEEETSEEESDSDEEEEEPKVVPKPAAVSRLEPAAVTSTRTPERKDSREEAKATGYSWRNQASGSFDRDESPKYGRVRSSATSAAVAAPAPEPEDRYSR